MGSIVVPYSKVEQAFNENPTAVHDAVDQAATDAAAGHPAERILGVGWSSNDDFLTPAIHPFRTVDPTHGPTI